MKYITKNLLIHSVIFLLASFLFRYLMSWSLSKGYFNGVWIVSAVYFLTLTVMIWRFSILDKKHLPLYDLGFRFHVATFLVWLLVSLIWFEFGSISAHEHIIQVYIASIIWLVVLLIHFIVYRLTRKKSFKGLKKSDIFD
jgi:L-asparagine transporter-like permease